ncbi:hypothetical protein RF55_11439 [Lasius niger]|uniref:Uncharacterized protein n=1 Tax=Lasius niger TaxID=67767 RepID=A0A0J7N8M1_LASNI|nr:hypothetical protein RF55_11439 [Lasius niger]
MTEIDSFSSKPSESLKANPHLEKALDSASLSASERSKLSSASYLKAPSEPEVKIPAEGPKIETPQTPEEKTEEALAAAKAAEEKKRLEEELAKAKEKAEAEARRELTDAQIQAKTPKTEKEMLEELDMLTATKNLTPSQIGSVLQWLIKQEILQSERIKHLQKEVTRLSALLSGNENI